MDESLQPYREAIAQRVHTICYDRNLNPSSSVDTEAGCRIERFLPQLVALARGVGRADAEAFYAGFERDICSRCGQRDAAGVCPVRERAECCLYRYLPLVYEAIHHLNA